MVITKWKVTEPIEVLSTELDGLVPGAYCQSSAEIDTDATHLWFELYLPAFSLISEGVVEVYLLPKFDENYVLGGPGVIPPRNTLVGAYVVTGSLLKRIVTEVPVLLPPFPFKIMVKNYTAAAFPNGGSLSIRFGYSVSVIE